MVLTCENGTRTPASRYAIRLRDLKPQQTITAVCTARRRHKATMRLWEITRGRSEHTHLTAVEASLRCRRCGDRGGARLYVTVSDDE